MTREKIIREAADIAYAHQARHLTAAKTSPYSSLEKALAQKAQSIGDEIRRKLKGMAA